MKNICKKMEAGVFLKYLYGANCKLGKEKKHKKAVDC